MMAIVAVIGWLTVSVSDKANKVRPPIKPIPATNPSSPSKNLVVNIIPISQIQIKIPEIGKPTNIPDKEIGSPNGLDNNLMPTPIPESGIMSAASAGNNQATLGGKS